MAELVALRHQVVNAQPDQFVAQIDTPALGWHDTGFADVPGISVGFRDLRSTSYHPRAGENHDRDHDQKTDGDAEGTEKKRVSCWLAVEPIVSAGLR